MGNLSAREIISRWLFDHGYDGLCRPGECGCRVIDDFMPCDGLNTFGPTVDCVAGYEAPADNDDGWLIQEEKPGSKGPGA